MKKSTIFNNAYPDTTPNTSEVKNISLSETLARTKNSMPDLLNHSPKEREIKQIVNDKIKNMLGIFCLLCICLNFSAQPIQQWIGNHNGTSNQLDYGRVIQVDASGNSYIGGSVTNTGAGKDITVIKYNSAGVQQWIAIYNGTSSSDDWIYGMAIDNGGNVYATGFTTTSASGKDFVLVKFNSAGSFQWAKQYNGPANLDDNANHITIDPWGNVAITGISKGLSTADDYATVKYSPSGSQLWVRRYDGPANAVDDARTIASDRSGNFYVSGGSTGIGSDYDFATVKYDSTGTQMWAARYNGPKNNYDLVYYQGSVVVDSLKNVYITGYSTGLDSTLDYATIKYDSLGNQVWLRRFSTETGGTDYADALHIDKALNVYVTGGSFKTGSDYEFATIKYDPNGNQQWIAYYNGTGNGWDEAYGVLTDDSLNVYVGGRSPGATTSADYQLVKYSPSGNQVWQIRYNHNGYDWPFNLRRDPTGCLFLGGWTSPANGMADMTIIKYCQSPLGVDEIGNANSKVEIYPNPSNDFFSIKVLSSRPLHRVSYKVYDSIGKEVFKKEISTEDWFLNDKLPTSDFQPGIYFIQLNINGEFLTKKIVLERF